LILDSSAVIALLLREPGFEMLERRFEQTPGAGIGTPTLVETGLVLVSRAGQPGRTELAKFLQQRDVTVIPFGPDHWTAAVDAFLRYGKGRHPARLNLGDCMTYATAKLAGQPLLCLGNDFAQTDLPLVT